MPANDAREKVTASLAKPLMVEYGSVGVGMAGLYTPPRSQFYQSVSTIRGDRIGAVKVLG